MIEGSAAICIARPVATVYRFIAVDYYRNYPCWSPEVVALTPLTPGPWREGALARQVRVDQGRRSDTTFRATRLEPDRRMLIDGVSAAYHADYELEGEGEGSTLLSFRFRLDRLDLFMLPFEKLIRSTLADGAARTAHNLKGLIEAECPVAPDVDAVCCQPQSEPYPQVCRHLHRDASGLPAFSNLPVHPPMRISS